MARASDRKLARSAQSAELYLRGLTYSQIAEQLEISYKQVRTDVALARECWRDRASQAIATRLYEEVARIDRVERAAWEGWDRSLRDAVQTTTEDIDRTEGGETKLKIVRVPQTGNPAFLKMISDCIKQRCELLGLLDPGTRDQLSQESYDEVVSVVIETREQWNKLKPMTYDEFEDAQRRGSQPHEQQRTESAGD